MLRETRYNVSRNKGGEKIVTKSRADYFRERRKKTRNFSVEVDRNKMELFEDKLSQLKKTKTQWLNEKIDDELKK